LQMLKLRIQSTEVVTMETMLNDIKRLKDDQKAWLESKYCDGKKGLDVFMPIVLTGRAWILPTEKIKIMLPHSVSQMVQEYQKYFAELPGDRKLVERNDLSHVEMRVRLGKKKYKVKMTAPQAVILMLFEKEEKLTIPKIQNACCIKNANTVIEHLLTMLRKPTKKSNAGIICKVKVKGQKMLPLRTSDHFYMNDKFKGDKVMFELPAPKREVAKPKDPPRNIRLEAALVRTMKASRKMEEKKLIMTAMDQVRSFFKPEVRDVKRCIEQLIKQKYMKRADEKGFLDYLA